MPAHPMHRYHIDGVPQPPHDWADPPSEWETDVEDDMHLSAMAIIAIVSMAIGFGVGWLLGGVS